MEWVPGEIIGHGSFSTVRLATPKTQNSRLPQIMAVKSSNLSHANMLLHEKSILDELKHCPYIIRCFGNDHTKENGKKIYNMFLEYAAGGTLADKLKQQPNSRFQESEVQRYTKSILKGVNYIHKKGYVHRDLKPENILFCNNNIVKIADFGLARRSGEKKKRDKAELRGTFLYLSPEALSKSEQEPPSDVWAIGCIVAEMFSGVPLWQRRQGEDGVTWLTRIALFEEMPEISKDLSPEGRDFLAKILIKDPAKRWTAQMLLDHPFVADQACEEAATSLASSPRGPLDWNGGYESNCSVTSKGSHRISIAEKFRRLMTYQGRDWSVSNHWICARKF